VVVAPALKKNIPNTGKAREHIVLKPNRPPFITILTLVRDAAAKLQNGVGTRADICEFLKQSQYIAEDIPEKKIKY
jgi:nuclear factor related to kappa-B-binding protein